MIRASPPVIMSHTGLIEVLTREKKTTAGNRARMKRIRTSVFVRIFYDTPLNDIYQGAALLPGKHGQSRCTLCLLVL
jgi:hypothetical protein